MEKKLKEGKKPVTLVIFEGGQQSSSVEAELVTVRHALLLDNIDILRSSPMTGDIFLLTNYSSLAREAGELGVHVVENDIPPHKFSFGAELQKIVEQYDPKYLFYLGGAGAPLLTRHDFEGICQTLISRERAILTNNSQSADLVAFTPPSLLLEIPPPLMDNTLAVELQDGCGITQELVPPTLGTMFDLDTPADLLVLGATSFAGPRARQQLSQLSLESETLARAREVLTGDYEDVLLMGRVGAPVIARINLNLKVRLRVFSEERGMKALGRIREKKVVSLMGHFLDEVGLEAFFAYISQVCACAFIDSRVIFSHRKLDPTDSDRFNSDLGRWQKVEDPFIREFTRVAAKAPIPIVLGGHSLILGGLWALVEDIGPQY